MDNRENQNLFSEYMAQIEQEKLAQEYQKDRPFSAPPHLDSHALFLYQDGDYYTKNFTRGFLPIRMDDFYSEFYEKYKNESTNKKNPLPPPIVNDERSINELRVGGQSPDSFIFKPRVRRLSTVSSLDCLEDESISSPGKNGRKTSNLDRSDSRRYLDVVYKILDDIQEENPDFALNKSPRNLSAASRPEGFGSMLSGGSRVNATNIQAQQALPIQQNININVNKYINYSPSYTKKGISSPNVEKGAYSTPSVENLANPEDFNSVQQNCLQFLTASSILQAVPTPTSTSSAKTATLLTPPGFSTPHKDQHSFVPSPNIAQVPLQLVDSFKALTLSNQKPVQAMGMASPAATQMPTWNGSGYTPRSPHIETPSAQSPGVFPGYGHNSQSFYNVNTFNQYGNGMNYYAPKKMPSTNSPHTQQFHKQDSDEGLKTENVYQMAKDQAGCRLLQKRLDEKNPAVINSLFEKIMPYFVELMNDPFGNYLTQKMTECCTEEYFIQIIHTLKNNLMYLSTNPHGTRSVQKIIECAKGTKHLNLVITYLENHVTELVKDPNGNHVIQKCLYSLDPLTNQFIFNSIVRDCYEIACHKQGCCVLQKCIDGANPKQRATIINGIVANTVDLVKDPYGNYVVQYVIELKSLKVNADIGRRLLGHLLLLAREKFSSNVIEKCLELNEREIKDLMVAEIVQAPSFIDYLLDQYGNYVIQKALSVAVDPLFTTFINRLKPEMDDLKNSGEFGFKIHSKLTKSYPQLGGDSPLLKQLSVGSAGGKGNTSKSASKNQHNSSDFFGQEPKPSQGKNVNINININTNINFGTGYAGHGQGEEKVSPTKKQKGYYKKNGGGRSEGKGRQKNNDKY